MTPAVRRRAAVRSSLRTVVFLGAVLGCVCSAAHEVRPAYLRIAAVSEQDYDVLWKVPLVGGLELPLAPVFPRQCSASDNGLATVAGAALVHRLKLHCPSGLHGGSIAVDGLSRTLTDVMLHIELADGTRLLGVLRPSAPVFAVDDAASTPALAYLALGVEHLLLGFDHILFLLALLYFLHRENAWEGAKALAKAVTAFTLAHSVTLALSALDLVRLPQAPVEAVIALSILFLAAEWLRGTPNSLTARHTWLVAFAFGLLHGFGFAGALADIGLPKENLALALFLFNVGVEIGQLAVVAVALALIVAVRGICGRLRLALPRRVVAAPLAVGGCLAAYWFVERTASLAT